jgi:glycosyltransferase involved in cell wall biosynthesis
VAEQVPLVAISHDQAARSVDIPVATVIHHGVDVDCFPVGTGGNESLAFLGRMTPEKGVREAALVALEVGLPLRIAAKCREPAEVEYFEHEVRPLLGSGIEYLGEIGPADRAELLAESLALVNPIKWAEPFGLVMAEALACGTPVLASRCGAAPEIVDHGVTGFLCNDRTDMVAKIERLGEISRDACRTAAVTRFSTERMVRDYLDFFAVVLAGHGHQRSIAATGIAS